MVKTEDIDAMMEWLLGNYAYGHLDEIPDWVLVAFLRDLRLGEYLACVICHFGETKTDSVEELAAVKVDVLKVLRAQGCVRAWIVAERLRRMGKLSIAADVLLKELASLDYRGKVFMPDGRPFTSKIVEVSPGVAYIVGEEIDLCGE